MIKPAPKFLQWYLKKTGFAGITLPPSGSYVLPERLADERLIRHESKHWEQYQSLGAIKFYAKYLWLSARYGYRNNPMEVEARAAELTQ